MGPPPPPSRTPPHPTPGTLGLVQYQFSMKFPESLSFTTGGYIRLQQEGILLGGASLSTSGGPIPFCSPLPGPRSRSTEPALLKICSTQPVVRPVRTQRSRKKSASHREKVLEGRLVTLLKPHQDECEAMWGWGSTM